MDARLFPYMVALFLEASSSRKEENMYDERERFLIRYSHNFASFIVARASGAWIETTDRSGHTAIA